MITTDTSSSVAGILRMPSNDELQQNAKKEFVQIAPQKHVRFASARCASPMSEDSSDDIAPPGFALV